MQVELKNHLKTSQFHQILPVALLIQADELAIYDLGLGSDLNSPHLHLAVGNALEQGSKFQLFCRSAQFPTVKIKQPPSRCVWRKYL